ncbi:MAG: DNA polymerase III subunit delta [Limnochordaceae bacterium]|nr:DNA polymerase III subunit delta [Limnochordaceae bacterium]
MSSKQAQKAHSATEPPAVYLLLGEDPFWVAESWQRLRIQLLGPQAGDPTAAWNEQSFDASECAAVRVLEAAQVLPFLGGRRLIRVERVDSWPAAEQNLLADGLARIQPPNYLVLVAAKAGSLVRGLREAVERAGQVVEVPEPDTPRLVDWLQQRARQAGGSLTAEAAQRLVEAMGPYPQALATELDKLLTYAANRPVTADEVNLLGSLSWTQVSDYRIFDLADALGRRQPAAALQALRDLLESGRPPLAILATLSWHWRRLLAVVEARARGVPQNQVAARLQLRPFQLRKLSEQACRLTLAQAEEGLIWLARTEADIKMGRREPSVALVLLCIRLPLLGETPRIEALSRPAPYREG